MESLTGCECPEIAPATAPGSGVFREGISVPQKHCGRSGCHIIVDIGVTYCPRHQAEYDKARAARQNVARRIQVASGAKPSRRWYGLAGWKRRREKQLRLFPLCKICSDRGFVTPASVADHLEPHREDPDKFWRGALQSLCASCHSSVKQREEAAAMRAEGGGAKV